jgi:hypothetical protein
MKEQLPLPFEPELPQLVENDQCQACGNFFESVSSCAHCMGNKKKAQYFRNHPGEKLPPVAPRTSRWGKKKHERN